MKLLIKLYFIISLFIGSLYSTEIEKKYLDNVNLIADVNDSLSLVSLYNATNGENWFNKSRWLTSTPLSSWYGVSLNENGRVSGLNLRYNNLVGDIPNEIGNLTGITKLELNRNKLNGSIPKEIGNLSNLKILNLSTNELTGTIPIEINKLDSLIIFNIYDNKIRDTIPLEITMLKNLETLNLGGNEFFGTIPVEISQLKNLDTLFLASNKLTGTIPKELSNLNNLTQLSLEVNELIGNIPKELGNLSNVTQLSLGSNELIGNIPLELSNLTKLKLLGLQNNKLSGNIPKELGNIKELENLGLSGNGLEGAIPQELGNLHNLKYLFLFSNKLNGNIPSEIGNLKKLIYLNLKNNQLEGRVPSEINNLNNLEATFLNDNKFDFSDLFEIENISGTINYSPQDSLGEEETKVIEIGEDFKLTAENENIPSNVYRWFRNGELIQNQTNYELTLSNVQKDDEGVYSCKVTNSDLPLLTLHRRPVRLTFDSELSVNSEFYKRNGISIFPNPAKDFVTIKIDKIVDEYNIKIVDVLGNVFNHSVNNNQNNIKMDLSKFDNGSYNIVVNSKSINYVYPIIINK